ncbi:MAG: NAD(P)-binding protein [SAR324 cluster bacterium]|nr:NAD(P)-binding protein [SAR324 cluster bacterium]
MKINPRESNPILDFAHGYEFPDYTTEKGLQKVVAFGDSSHKCPTYVLRTPPCQAGCPAGEDIRGFHNLLTGLEKSENSWNAAFDRIVDKNPFPAIMGRVCPHPCETACNRQFREEPVGINAVEQAIGDHGISQNLKLPAAGPDTGKRVAIVGGGPAGLSAAYQLRRYGHAVTIYDDKEKLGGTIRYGIMGYRVDREVLDAEIQRIVDLGMELKMEVKVGVDISLEQLEADYDAVFIGVGAQLGRPLPISGFGNGPQTTNAVEFLKAFEIHGESISIGKNVLVVGDGNVAMDVARLARRLGSKAGVISGVPRDEMSAYPEEFDDALIEGTQMHYLTGTLQVLEEDGKVRGIKCTKMEKKAKGEEGWNSPIPFFRYKAVEGQEFELECDMIVASIGQATDMTGLESTTNNTPWLKLENNFRVKGKENVFGGGDALKIDLITTAVGHGRLAAESIDCFLRDVPYTSQPYQDVIDVKKQDIAYFLPKNQIKRNHHHLENEKVEGNYSEILVTLSKEETVEESRRCMSCGLCFECNQCLTFCPQEAISRFKKNPLGEVMYTDYNKCVGCHICANVCPCGYIQMGMGEDL